MDIYKRKSRWKWYLAIAAAIIVAISMLYTKYLTDKLAEEERKKVEQLRLSYETLVASPPMCNGEYIQVDYRLQNHMMESNTTIPVLWVNEYNIPEDARNYGEENDADSLFRVRKLQEYLRNGVKPIVFDHIEGVGTQYLYYEHSYILKLLTYYPYIQLVLIAAFITFGYIGFSSSRRAEQNRVWAGMAKETAHQLGTPISGIVAWIEHLRMLRENDEEVGEVLDELANDVKRLELVADRFSKIGSAPELTPVDINSELEKCRAYMQRRAPRKVEFVFPDPSVRGPDVKINSHLFDWVIENLLRNALDAMDGTGKIEANVYEDEKYVYIDISDTGKGIPAGKFKTVFQPGYSTKKRGWGLGLSLAKRIVEEYHSGKIFVKKSDLDEGTTFTIQMPK